MRLLFDVLHPAHVHFFRPLAEAAIEGGGEVLFTAREKDVTRQLLEAYALPGEILTGIGGGMVGLAREMAVRGSVPHHSHLYGVSTRTRFKLAFPDPHQFGENVAVNRDPGALHRALMKSTAHRLNRMDPSFTHVGVAVARAGKYQLYLTEVFARVFDEAPLAEIVVLYTELAPDALAHDEPTYGEVVGETVRIGPPTEDNPEFWTQRGIDAFNARRFAEAIELFSRSIEIDSGYEYAHYNLARAYLGNGELDAALAILQRQTARHPDDVDA